MKTLITLIIMFLSMILVQAQLVDNVDAVSPFNDGLTAVQKGDSWAFIDDQGVKVIDYRHDLVITNSSQSSSESYPKFQNGRCSIFSDSDNIRLYGYIDKTGKTIVEPQFLSPAYFNEHQFTIVQRLNKNSYGTNGLLNKSLVRYTYNELIINDMGEVLNYLNGPTHVIPYIDKMKTAPVLLSKLLSQHLVATQDENKKWTLLKVKTSAE